jgi:Zn finger protein HypA/HybF involved in hydrogenase expression
MHEVAAMRGAVAAALDAMRAEGAARITRVYLVLGASGHLTEDAALQHMAVFAAGTPLADAEVEVSWLPATYQCFTCLHHFESALPTEEVTCPMCGGSALEIEHRDVCYVAAIDVADDLSDSADTASREDGASAGSPDLSRRRLPV